MPLLQPVSASRLLVAGSFPEHIIQQVARSADFVRIVGRYCDLERRGGRFWGLCPFHKEKTGSFSVDPDNGLYYCFGCKEGGNVFTFLEKMEGLSFPEAVRALAAEAGIDLSQYELRSGPAKGELSRLREINELATVFYEKCLEKARGAEEARRYLAGRSINDESVERWRLGYAPDGWDHFLKCALGREYKPEMVEKAGLVLPRQNTPGHYDRFRNRLMFPIADGVGRTIGFGARVIDPEDEPKYLNSPETPLFSKGSCFFGMAQARDEIRGGRQAVILEGYTDVIMAHQHGIREAVAVLGTALTSDHARRLSRICDTVVLVFDGDEAGLKSAMRSIEVLLNEDVEIRAAALPEGKDPCELILEEGGDAFRRRIEESDGFYEFRLEAARKQYDTSTIDGATAAFHDLAQMALAVRDEARRDLIVRRMAQELGVRESDAWAYMDRQLKRPARRREGQAKAEDAGVLTADQSLPGELLGFLLAHPMFMTEAAERVDVDVMKPSVQTRLIGAWLGGDFEGDDSGVKSFMASLTDAEEASAASAALAQERAREERITQTTARQRLEGYLRYLELKKMDASGPARTAARGKSDAELKALERRLREKDRKSAHSK